MRKLARLLSSDLANVADLDRALCERLLADEPALAAAASAAKRLAALLRKESSEELETVLSAAAETALANLAGSLRRDAAAVQAALDHPWTTSPVEGQVNRIKAIKREMYGRASFPLLRQRVLNAV